MSAGLVIRVTSRSAKPGIGDWKNDAAGRRFLEVRVAAAPTDGAANDEVVKILAKALGIAKSDVRIVTGATSRLKRIQLPLNEADVRARLNT